MSDPVMKSMTAAAPDAGATEPCAESTRASELSRCCGSITEATSIDPLEVGQCLMLVNTGRALQGSTPVRERSVGGIR